MGFEVIPLAGSSEFYKALLSRETLPGVKRDKSTISGFSIGKTSMNVPVKVRITTSLCQLFMKMRQ